ncbi:uncharacterized protein EHS24_009267 [Apiotrichum porosum]|uniref:5-hydroxyisourate hydrolase n=1 Tax=Apiotrichum porosum TaxID=105984 RepID=A0A427XL79_9TREE|nr:uncharacterized protein EHS24_009267 [Apiotrichum porosum]RSH79616.1 hypothetical protein EHS24_009267 [Apiotrichum porosum]
MSKSPITCHVLDASRGKPAAGVLVELHRPDNEVPIATGVTDADGRCTTLLPHGFHLDPGAYKMTFKVGEYFAAAKVDTFYPFVEITFNYSDPSQHYHIPLLLSPFSYSTYRGS